MKMIKPLSNWRRVAFVEEFFEILKEVHCREKGHIAEKKTVTEVIPRSL